MSVKYLNDTGTGRLVDHLRLKGLSSVLYGGEAGSGEYDPTYTASVSTLPYNFYNGSAVIYNGEIHILGSSRSSDYSKHYKWNGLMWLEVSSLPYNFCNGSAVVYNNEIHIFGSSYYSGDYQNATNHYKWDGTDWSEVSTLPYYFYNGCSVIYDDEIHIIGGIGSNRSHYKWDGTNWISVSTLPYIFYWGSAVVYNDEIHILGSGEYGYFKRHYKLDGSNWSEVSTLPYNFYNGCAVVLNNEIHILGAYDSANYTEHYAWSGTNWNEVSTLPYNFREGSSVIYNDDINILGGTGEEGGPTNHYQIGRNTVSEKGWEPILDSGSSSSSSYYYQIAEIEGIDPNDYIVVQADQTEMSLSNIEEMEKDKVRYIDHDEDGLIFIAKKAPSFDIPLNIVKQGCI